MRLLIITFILLLCNSASAQWKKIANFTGPDGSEYITCVYFLDLPGPPRVGFVGTESRLYKTTDGGRTWKLSWVPSSGRDYDLYWVTDICFKDSLTGWFSMFGDTDACYRTTDGGNTWKEVYSAPYGGEGVCYSPITNRLFLTLAGDIVTGIRLSTDLGKTWSSVSDTSSAGMVFLTGDMGVASAYTPFSDTSTAFDTSFGIFHTSDGGLSWHYIRLPEPRQSFGYPQPLAIAGTATCFVSTMGEVTVWRSDDYGENWKNIADFGPFEDSNFNEVGPYGTGYIKGDLSRLSIQTDSGMYVSTDSGVTWRNDGGPVCATSVEKDLFYSAKGVTIAALTYVDMARDLLLSGGLWEEIWPQSGVSKQEPNDSFGVNVFPNPTAGPVTIRGASGSVVVTNVLGEMVLTANPQQPSSFALPKGDGISLDLSKLPAGTYFARIETASGVVVRKILKE